LTGTPARDLLGGAIDAGTRRDREGNDLAAGVDDGLLGPIDARPGTRAASTSNVTNNFFIPEAKSLLLRRDFSEITIIEASMIIAGTTVA
jgi:hypothetical protein